MSEILLGINIDHIATLRNSRKTNYPNIIEAAFIAEKAGADSITVHLRQDRRHIKDNDVIVLKQTIKTKMNLEIAIIPEMINFASKIQPESCCLVPEKYQELTTEQGLNLLNDHTKIQEAIQKLKKSNIEVSLFIDPNNKQIDAAIKHKVSTIEINTGYYAETQIKSIKDKKLSDIKQSIQYAANYGLKINAGHGLNYYNIKSIAAIANINELNIGHSVISEGLLIGLKKAIKKMKKIIKQARK